ncbi:MAG: response regulator, partial [Bacteroidia bacterium]|nr:response regulator [Bacteroidia bacterium]
MSSMPVNNRILIIDDDAVVRDSIRHILNPPRLQHPALADLSSLLFEQDGSTSPQEHDVYLIHEAENGSEGITKVHQSILNHMPYALVLLDMRMPGIDGLQTCEKIREIDPQAKICFLTAFS